ncbi:MAG: hypothetical protein EOO56_29260, partial [Hymenobacter sp.]
METTASWAAPAPAPTAPTYRISTLLGSLVAASAVLSDYLFWHESAGLNVLVYMVFLVVVHLVLLPR